MSFREYDIWDPFASSVLDVSKAAGDPKKKPISHKSGAKNNPIKETFIVH